MVKIKILALGKIKEKYLRQGIDEYLKRLRPYAQVTVVEVEDLPIPERKKTAEGCCRPKRKNSGPILQATKSF